MESLSYLIQQLFYSFFAGCVVNFYLIAYYFMLKHAGILSNFVISPKRSLTFVFIICAAIIGVFIEGVCQLCIEKYYYDEKPNNGTQSFWQRCLKGFLNIFIATPTILRVCENFTEKKKTAFFINDFIKDSKILVYSSNEPNEFYDYKELYNALQKCAIVIQKSGVNIYRFRDISFILQMIRLSFFFILIVSYFSGISVMFIKKMCPLVPFNISCVVGSLFFICIIPRISNALGRRHIREVEYAYSAITLKLPIQK